MKRRIRGSYADWKEIEPFIYKGRDLPEEGITDKVRAAASLIVETELDLPEFLSERFCIAICCDLDFEIQREAAWFLVSDMLNGNFRWITHLSHLSVEKALLQAGLISKDYFNSETMRSLANRSENFEFDSSELPKRIIEKFKLPTHRLHPNKILTADEKSERRLFNASYSCGFGNPSVL